jgi:hypothetical protein
MTEKDMPSILTRKADAVRPHSKFGTPLTALEWRVQEVYARIDSAVERELARLRRDEGVAPTCRRGCCSCCGQHIQTSPPEAHALGQYIQRTFSAQQIAGLRRRTRQWLAWHDARRHAGIWPEPAAGLQAAGHEPFCPLLVDCACSAYPVRPVICRTHYVSSVASACCPAHGDRPVDPPPAVLTSILEAAQPLSQPLRTDIEAAGLEFSRSIMLLPHWLAIEMGWDSGGAP